MGRLAPCGSAVKGSPTINPFQLTFLDFGECPMITSRLSHPFIVMLVITCNYKAEYLNTMVTYYPLPAVEVRVYRHRHHETRRRHPRFRCTHRDRGPGERETDATQPPHQEAGIRMQGTRETREVRGPCRNLLPAACMEAVRRGGPRDGWHFNHHPPGHCCPLGTVLPDTVCQWFTSRPRLRACHPRARGRLSQCRPCTYRGFGSGHGAEPVPHIFHSAHIPHALSLCTIPCILLTVHRGIAPSSHSPF